MFPLDSSRKNINVKQLLSNLESKSILKRGKYIKAGSRTVDSWIKILPNPGNDEEFKNFKQGLTLFYQMEMSKYLDWYEAGDRNQPVFTEAGEQVAVIQRQWIPHLRQKLFTVVNEGFDSSE